MRARSHQRDASNRCLAATLTSFDPTFSQLTTFYQRTLSFLGFFHETESIYCSIPLNAFNHIVRGSNSILRPPCPSKALLSSICFALRVTQHRSILMMNVMIVAPRLMPKSNHPSTLGGLRHGLLCPRILRVGSCNFSIDSNRRALRPASRIDIPS